MRRLKNDQLNTLQQLTRLAVIVSQKVIRVTAH